MKARENIILKEYAYYRTGGRTRFFYQPASVAELAEAISEIKARKLKCFYLGAGTNSLVSDEDWSGAVISFAKMNSCEFNGPVVRVGAGVGNTDFAKSALAQGLAGAGWMNRLPGQLGGTVRMNARCYGGEISQIVTKTTTVDQSGKIKIYEGAAPFRGYKDTIFMTNGEAIADLEITLQPGDKTEIEKLMRHCEQDRESKGQFLHPTCGCVFKNDYSVGVPSGMLLDAAGIKELKTPGVSINPQHANFVYNINAPSSEILEMTFVMRERVYEKFGVWLEYEMEILGSLPQTMLARLVEKRPSRPRGEELEALRKRFQGARSCS